MGSGGHPSLLRGVNKVPGGRGAPWWAVVMGRGGAEGVSALRLPGTRSRSLRYPHGTACLRTHSPHSGSSPQSCSSDTKLLVILHVLQAASHLGDCPCVPSARMALTPSRSG